MMWSDWGWSFGEVQIFILSGRESSLVQTFCEQLDITHSSVHMTRRFVIQGCPSLTVHTFPLRILTETKKLHL